MNLYSRLISRWVGEILNGLKAGKRMEYELFGCLVGVTLTEDMAFVINN